MPTFVSDQGVWHPAKEKVGLVNKSDEDIVYKGKKYKPGEPFVYEGPDREAVKVLMQESKESLGKDFRTEPEFLQAVRNMGFNNVDEYLKHIGYDEDAEKNKFKDKISSVKAHEEPVKVSESVHIGGGKDTSGNKDNDLIGGFGEERLRNPKEVKRSRGRPKSSK